MRQSLALVTAPISEPVTLAEAKAWCRIDGTDDDTTITTLVGAARASAEEYLRRSLVTQSWKLTLDLPSSGIGFVDGVYNLPVSALYGNLPRHIPLPKGPVQSITSVTTYDRSNTAAVLDAASYRVDTSGDRLILNNGASWPSSIRQTAGCEIVYATGYGDANAVPKPIKTGILIHLASLYEQRGLCDDAMDLPPGAKQLYGQYRIMDYRRG